MCPATCLTVIGQRLRGNDGTYRCTSASRSSRPLSSSLPIAAAVTGFETLPTRNRVSRVTGTRCSRFAYPNPSDHTTSPSTSTATDIPGIPRSAMSAATVRRPCSMAGPCRDGAGASASAWAASGRASGSAAGTATSIASNHATWRPRSLITLRVALRMVRVLR